MITVRKGEERGTTRIDWLDSRHTFSFGDYHDPRQLGFRSLRVLNDDRVQAGTGFGTHPHRDMEIVTWVLEGGLRHQDSMGHGGVISPGEVQRMSAGTGVLHSEWNASDREPVHFLQIWIVPERPGLEPGYEQKGIALAPGALRLMASRTGRDGSATVHQDADIWVARLEPGQRVEHALRPGRHAWVQLARGAVKLGDHELRAGDGAALSDEERVALSASAPAEVLVFDLG